MKQRHVGTRLFGFLIALSFHAALISALVWDPKARKARPPEIQGPGASSIVSSAEPGTTMVLIQIREPSKGAEAEAIASRGSTPPEQAVQMVSPDAAPAFDISVAEATPVEDAGAPAEAESAAVRAMFFTRYTGQIDARILRAWRRPRSAVDNAKPKESFRCQVRIQQDSRGFVQEVQLVSCNGTLEWQRSLVTAIDQASPLPAPPRPSVFTNVLSMTFEATAWRAGLPEDDYEPVISHSAFASAGGTTPR